jgi:hypothetical protein
MRAIAFAAIVVAITACTKMPPDEPAPATAPVAAAPAPKPASACPEVPTVDADGNPLPQPQYTADSPVGIVSRFYDGFPKGDAGGAPDAATLDAWRPLLSKGLAAALERARAERDAAAAAHPDEKPPYVEGALFGSLFEGWTTAQPLSVAMEGETASVPVCFVYEADGQRTEWADTVKLVREDDAWKIDDVAYGGQWDFANTGTLREALPKE